MSRRVVRKPRLASSNSSNSSIPPSGDPQGGMPLRLQDLPTDALEKLFEHVRLKFPLKVTCRAMRDAHPDKTDTPHSFVMQTLAHFEWARGCGYECDEEAVLQAARFGRDDVVHWLVKILKVKWDPRETFGKACASGSIAVLDFLAYEAMQDGDVNEAIEPFNDEASWASAIAAAEGHVHVLPWLQERGHYMGYSTAMSAARGGHIAVLEYCDKYVDVDHQEFLEQAAKYGHTDCAVWLKNHGCTITGLAAAYAAAGGHLDTLKWIVAQQPSLLGFTVLWAATRNDHLDCVKFFFQSYTASFYSLDDLMEKACFAGSCKVARWLLEDKYLTEVKGNCILRVIERNRTRVLEMLLELGHVPKDDPHLCEHAVVRGAFAALKLLRNHNCQWLEGKEGDKNCIAIVAIEVKRNSIFKWMVKTGQFKPSQRLMNAAMFHGNLDALVWLMRQAPFDWDELRDLGLRKHDNIRITSFIERGDHHVYNGWPAPWEEGEEYNDAIMPDWLDVY